MPEEKEYGYARDKEDIADPGSIPTEVTGNAIDFFLMDHPVESESEPSEGSRLIKNHDHILEVSAADSQVATNGYLDAFDAEQRAAVVTASGSLEPEETEETEESDEQ